MATVEERYQHFRKNAEVFAESMMRQWAFDSMCRSVERFQAA